MSEILLLSCISFPKVITNTIHKEMQKFLLISVPKETTKSQIKFEFNSVINEEVELSKH